MDSASTEAVRSPAEQAVEALARRLRLYILQHRPLWSRDRFGSDFWRGEAYALTGLALLPELRAVLDALDDDLGAEMEQWHENFQPDEEA